MELDEIISMILIISLLYESLNCLEKMNRRRYWVSPSLQNRDVDGLFATSFNHLRTTDTDQFKAMVRMTPEAFDRLFELLAHDLTKHSNREAISAKCRLFLTLVYLANGDSTQYLSESFKMGTSTVRKIIHESCEVIWQKLLPKYLPRPSKTDWLQISEDFETIWNLPNCVGVIDGRCIDLTRPPTKGTTSSIYLLAVCDANHLFTAIDTGTFASIGVGGIFNNTEFGRRLTSKSLDLPENEYLPSSDIKFPYYFVGDGHFPLMNNLMRPYPGSALDLEREIFNNRLSNVRRAAENAFGILTARWRVLLGKLPMKPESAEVVVKATVVLHNFLKIHDDTYCSPEFSDTLQGDIIVEGTWRREVGALPKLRPGHFKNSPKSVFNMRDCLKDYILLN